MPPRRRTITVPAVRRPRVAGQPPATRRGEPDRADPALDPALDHGSAVDTDPADGGAATGTAAVAPGPA
ncbi:MAG: hypothetical protein NTW05_05370, partial [Pseudonocardiales bacterium]|nr:hypothetical protein [Pseudonocardiales bacterium]